MMDYRTEAISLSAFNAEIGRLVSAPVVTRRWITAELLDVNVRGGHCYMELVDKDPATGRTLARNRGIIWANNYAWMAAAFREATGQNFATGLKVLLCVTANFHSVFGLSLVITDIDPSYTMGDLKRRRMMIINRLRDEGILDMNRTLEWSVPVNRIAVISARGAAGYGDFMHQLYSNPNRLRFTTRLFDAVMQGEKAAESIINALGRIASEQEAWDAVVIIRGGGSTSDLATLDDYSLAAHVAQFPLPVIVGIGHERDETVLDYVAALRVKTPTAAAEWLIARGNAMLDELHSIATALLHAASDRLSGSSRQLAFYAGQIPALARERIHRTAARLDRCASLIAAAGSGSIAINRRKLDLVAQGLANASANAITRGKDRLHSLGELLTALSPEATLRRGYTITLADGACVTDPGRLSPGTVITTTFAQGSVQSTVK